MSLVRVEDPINVAVLAGGDSPERAISLQSGTAVVDALAAMGHRVDLVDPLERALDGIDWSGFDAAFVAMHGGAGEDGRLQAVLDELGIPYTGSGPRACWLAMHKAAAKERFVESGVPTPNWEVIEPDENPTRAARRVGRLGFPLVVKPESSGSSLGLSIARSGDELVQAIATARQFDARVMVEPLVAGREFTVALVDDRPLPLVEILSPERVFSYEAKYLSMLTEFRLDVRLAEACAAELTQAAVAAGAALGTAGLARVDLILGHDARVWVLEVNAVPGMTPRSLAPLAAAQVGIDFPVLCNQLMRHCLQAASVS